MTASTLVRPPRAGRTRTGLTIALVFALLLAQACALHVKLVGDYDELLDQSVLDLCGEFANQLAGSWLTGLDLKQRFTLDRPQVERHTSGGDGTPVMVNDQPAVLGLTLDAEADDEAGERTGR